MGTSSGAVTATKQFESASRFRSFLDSAGPNENVLYSPFGHILILAILSDIGSKDTRKALVPYLEVAGEDIDVTVRHIYRMARAYEELPEVRFLASSSLWISEPHRFRAEAEQLLRDRCQCDCFCRDFQYAGLRDEIEKWLAKVSKGLLRNYTGDVRQAILLALGVLHFKGDWASRFDARLTEVKPFTLRDGTEIQVPRMQGDREFQYYEDEECQSVRLPYGSVLVPRMAMQVILPASGVEFPGILKRPPDASQFIRCNGHLELPRFQLNSERDLPFPDDYSLDARVTVTGLSTSFPAALAQRIVIRVDEEGTEAVALTQTVFYCADDEPKIPPKPFRMIVDRPFYFMISDVFSELPLFVGRVSDPRFGNI